MRLLTSALRVARLEARLFQAFPKLRFAAAGIVLIPALYAFIYLESVWDPASRTGALAALVVNLDRGTVAGGKEVRLGSDVAASLKAKHAFDFRDDADAEHARREVREGHALFALIIPADFSASAMAPGAPGAGKIVVYASEGNNYQGAGFAKRFASELGHQLNETLNEKRWDAVLGTAASSADNLARLRDGVAKLRAGAGQLDAGMERARTGSAELAAGAGQLDAKKPAPADLQAIKAGAAQLAGGHAELQKAMPQLEDGARQLADGAAQLRDQTKPIPLVGGKISAGAGQLADGATKLQAGIHQAGEGEAKLAAGSQTLSKGVAQLADGFAAYSAGASQLAGGAKQLAGGIGEFKKGSSQLAAGLVTLESSLPAGVPGIPGTARGLASSVEPEIEIDAPVKSNGMGFAPNFIPVALWLGAVMTAFIFHLRRLPEEAQGASRAALLLGKMTVLGSINIAQALTVLAMSALLLGIQPVHAAGLALTVVASSLTFMLVILLLVRAFGDAGKAVALILLILQLSSAGGVAPIELTSDFYRTLSPWLPFTWSVKAVRASAFGAFGGEWGSAIAAILAFGVGAFALSLVVGKWKFVPREEHRPAMDI